MELKRSRPTVIILALMAVAVVVAAVAIVAGDGEEPEPGASSAGLQQISETRSPVVGTTYVSPLVEVYGDVFIGEESFVAGNTVLRAAPELRLEIGDRTNSQDNVLARAFAEDSAIGDETSIAHHALIRDSTIGDFAFVGFHGEIVNATVSDGALVSAGAVIRDVELPEDALVLPGQSVTTQEQADALPSVGEAKRSSSTKCSTSTRSLPRGTSTSTRPRATTMSSGWDRTR